MTKHYTLVDLFDKEFYTRHPAWMAVSDHLPDDLCILLIQHLNPKPGENVPVPNVIIWQDEYISPDDTIKCEFIVKLRFVIWYDTWDDTDKNCIPIIGTALFPTNVAFDKTEIIRNNTFLPVIYSQLDVELNGGDLYKTLYWKFSMESIHMFAKDICGIWFYQEDGNITYFYTDTVGKNPVTLCDYYTRYDPAVVKKIYMDYFNIFELNYCIYLPIFAYLHKMGKSIEDLNYADSISMDILESDHTIRDIEIKFSEHKLRDFKYDDYANDTLLQELDVDLDHFTIHDVDTCEIKHQYSQIKNSDIENIYYWSGIRIYLQNFYWKTSLANYYKHITFGLNNRVLDLSGIRW